MDQTHLSFQRGQEAWLAEFEKWWGLPSWAAALTAQVTAQLQATFEAQLTQLSVARRSAPKAKNFAKRKQFFFRRSISVVCARLLRSPAGR